MQKDKWRRGRSYTIVGTLWAFLLVRGTSAAQVISAEDEAKIKDLFRRDMCWDAICSLKPPSVRKRAYCQEQDYRVVADGDKFYVVIACVRGPGWMKAQAQWGEWWIVREPGHTRFAYDRGASPPMEPMEAGTGEWQKKPVAEWTALWDFLVTGKNLSSDAAKRLAQRFDSSEAIRFRVSTPEDCRPQDCQLTYPTTPEGQQVLERAVQAVVDDIVKTIKGGYWSPKRFPRQITVVVHAFDEQASGTSALVLPTKDVYLILFPDPPGLTMKLPERERAARSEYGAILQEGPRGTRLIPDIRKYGIARKVTLPEVEVEQGNEPNGTPTPRPRRFRKFRPANPFKAKSGQICEPTPEPSI